MPTTPTQGKGRGFASLSPEERTRIARIGGQRSRDLGVAHRWNSETAALAGKKGGKISKRKPKSSSNTSSIPRS